MEKEVIKVYYTIYTCKKMKPLRHVSLVFPLSIFYGGVAFKGTSSWFVLFKQMLSIVPSQMTQ